MLNPNPFESNRPCLHLVTFSGVHGTGKTTLRDDTAVALSDLGAKVFKVDSCAGEWFKNAQAIYPNLKCYDDIDRVFDERGEYPVVLRKIMQGELGVLLRENVVIAAEKVFSQASASYNNDSHFYILVDRWFTDLMTYTLLKRGRVLCPCAVDSIKSVLSINYSVLSSWLYRRTLGIGFGYTQHSVFVPFASSTFVQDSIALSAVKADRGTDDPGAWEFHYARCSPPFVRPLESIRIQKPSRQGRVAEVMDRVWHPYKNKPI